AAAGVAGALAGAALGLGGWFVYAPRLQARAGHVIDPLRLPWPLVAIAMALAVATAVAAAWRPARAAARVPAVAAMSGRPAGPAATRRLAVPACALLAAGLALLAASGGLAQLGVNGGTLGWGAATAYGGLDTLLLIGGLVATVLGVLLLTPLVVALPAALAAPAPAAVRLAVRDLGRYRTRSGAALAAVTFAIFGAVLTCILTAASYGTVPRETAMLQDSSNYTGTLYVATPALLRAFGITPGQVSPDADILTTRAGLAGVPGLELLGQGDIVTHMNPPGHEVSETH